MHYRPGVMNTLTALLLRRGALLCRLPLIKVTQVLYRHLYLLEPRRSAQYLHENTEQHASNCWLSSMSLQCCWHTSRPCQDASNMMHRVCRMIRAGLMAHPLQLFTLMAKGSNSILCLPAGFATAPLSSQILCASVAVMMITADHIVLHTACFISKLNGGMQKVSLLDAITWVFLLTTIIQPMNCGCTIELYMLHCCKAWLDTIACLRDFWSSCK